MKDPNHDTRERPQQPSSDEETKFFRQKYQPPLVSYVGLGRRVASSLTPLQALALAYAFPAFLGRATIDRAGAAEPAWAQELRSSSSYNELTERQLQMRKLFRRRYSGDSHEPLPRERYFALFSDGVLEKSYTLLGEVNAYALPGQSGYCAAVPVEEPGAIGVVFRGLPYEPNPLYRFITEPEGYASLFDEVSRDPRNLISPEVIASVSSDTEFVVLVPYEDVDMSVEYVFDMRLPEARQWMVDFFRNPPSVNTNDDLAHGAWLKLTASRYEFDLSSVNGWRSLQPVISDTNIGGNGMADLFACFLRRLGCGGIIYPSARSDHGVILNEGRIADHWGWNLVNYTGSSIPTRLAFEEITPLRPREGIYHFAEIDSGPQSGSFVSLGNSLNNKLANQVLFDQYAYIHGSEWRLKHQQNTLSVRGYCWYRRSYSLNRESDELIVCDKCDTPFLFGRAALLPWCPNCNFRGDLGVFANLPAFFMPYMANDSQMTGQSEGTPGVTKIQPGRNWSKVLITGAIIGVLLIIVVLFVFRK